MCPPAAAVSATSRLALHSPLPSHVALPSSLPPLSQVIPTPNLHRSNAAELIAQVPVIEVAAGIAMCDGGEWRGPDWLQTLKSDPSDAGTCKLAAVAAAVSVSRACGSPTMRPPAHAPAPVVALPPSVVAGGGATGHPIEFIQLDKRAGAAPATCKYCGLRYKLAPGGHHH
jgi:uncharacterized Zn-finger protein